MADHKPLPVTGYTTQPPEKVAVVNQNKRIEESVLRQLDLMQDAAVDMGFDARWLAIARTHIEQGFMAMNHAVFRPRRPTPEEMGEL